MLSNPKRFDFTSKQLQRDVHYDISCHKSSFIIIKRQFIKQIQDTRVTSKDYKNVYTKIVYTKIYH